MPEWKEKMLTGVKTHTCRSQRYGEPGDQFEVFGATFELVRVWIATLDTVAMRYFDVEGCASPDEFIEVWDKIHPRRRFNPDDVRWLHHFRLVSAPLTPTRRGDTKDP
jgi:hypothetical protein